jgi:hypothetical protein
MPAVVAVSQPRTQLTVSSASVYNLGFNATLEVDFLAASAPGQE